MEQINITCLYALPLWCVYCHGPPKTKSIPIYAFACITHHLHSQAIHRVAVAMVITLKPVIMCALHTRFSTSSFYTNSLNPISTFWYLNLLASHKLRVQVIKKLEVGVVWIEANYAIVSMSVTHCLSTHYMDTQTAYM